LRNVFEFLEAEDCALIAHVSKKLNAFCVPRIWKSVSIILPINMKDETNLRSVIGSRTAVKELPTWFRLEGTERVSIDFCCSYHVGCNLTLLDRVKNLNIAVNLSYLSCG
jgi:hypothetical protein